jgi:hypothetical protein
VAFSIVPHGCPATRIAIGRAPDLSITLIDRWQIDHRASGQRRKDRRQDRQQRGGTGHAELRNIARRTRRAAHGARAGGRSRRADGAVGRRAATLGAGRGRSPVDGAAVASIGRCFGRKNAVRRALWRDRRTSRAALRRLWWQQRASGASCLARPRSLRTATRRLGTRASARVTVERLLSRRDGPSRSVPSWQPAAFFRGCLLQRSLAELKTGAAATGRVGCKMERGRTSV